MRIMILGIFSLLMSSASAHAEPKAFKLEKEHTSVRVSWDYSGMVFPFLVFTDFEGTFLLDKDDPKKSTIDVTIPINSLWTPVEHMTENLQSEWYFDVENHPTAHFKATSYEVTGENTGIMRGPLTIKGITNEAEFHVTMNHYGFHPLAEFRDFMDKTQIVSGFSAHGVIKRSDYEITFVKVVSDEMTINIEAAFDEIKDEAEAE